MIAMMRVDCPDGAFWETVGTVVAAVVDRDVRIGFGVAVGVGGAGCCCVHPAMNIVEKTSSKTRKNVVFFIISSP